MTKEQLHVPRQKQHPPTGLPRLPGSARMDVAPTCSVREVVTRFLLFPQHFVNVPVIERVIMWYSDLSIHSTKTYFYGYGGEQEK